MAASEELTCRMRPRMSSTATPCGASAISRSVRAWAASTSSRRRFSSVTSRSTSRARSGRPVTLSCSGTASTETSRGSPVLEVVGLDDEAAHRLAVEGAQRGPLPLGQHPAVAAAARWGGEGGQLSVAVRGGRQPATGGVVVQQHLAVAVHDDEGVGDGLGDHPQVLGLAPGGQPRSRRLADQPVALPLHGGQHQAEQGGQHHERLQGQRLAGDVADVIERVAGGEHHEARA